MDSMGHLQLRMLVGQFVGIFYGGNLRTGKSTEQQQNFYRNRQKNGNLTHRQKDRPPFFRNTATKMKTISIAIKPNQHSLIYSLLLRPIFYVLRKMRSQKTSDLPKNRELQIRSQYLSMFSSQQNTSSFGNNTGNNSSLKLISPSSSTAPFGQLTQNNPTQPTTNTQNTNFSFANPNQNTGTFGTLGSSFNSQNAQIANTLGNALSTQINNSNSQSPLGISNNANSQVSLGSATNSNNQPPSSNPSNQTLSSNANLQATGCFSFGNNNQKPLNSNQSSNFGGFNCQPQVANPQRKAQVGGNLFAKTPQSTVPSNNQNQQTQPPPTNKPQFSNNPPINQPQSLFGSSNRQTPAGLFGLSQQQLNNVSNNQPSYLTQPNNLFNSQQQQPQNGFNLGGNVQQQPQRLFDDSGLLRNYDLSDIYGPNYNVYDPFNYNPFGGSQPTFIFNGNVQAEFTFNHPSQRPRFAFNAPNQSPTFSFNNQHTNPSFLFNQPSPIPNYGFGFNHQPTLVVPQSGPHDGPVYVVPPNSLFSQPVVEPLPLSLRASIATVGPEGFISSSSDSQRSFHNKNSNNCLFSVNQQKLDLKPIQKRDAEKKLAAVIVTLCNGTSYDSLFSQVQQKTLQGTQVMVYCLPSSLSFQLLSALREDYSAFNEEEAEVYLNLMQEMLEVQPSCVVFNWQCCSGYRCEHFNNERDTLFALVGVLIERGHMVMFSDFSLKALINDWDEQILGRCPFVRMGSTSKAISLYFNPSQLKECPSAQLRLLGDLVDSGECQLNCANETIQFSVDTNRIDGERYDLQILTVMRPVNIGQFPTFLTNQQCIGNKEGLTAHVLLTYKSGGSMLVSMGHWTELSRITPTEQKLFEVAEREYGSTFANAIRNQFSSLPPSQRPNFLSRNAVNFVQNQPPCSHMNRR